MLDDLDRLRNNVSLLQLLAHYARLANPDRAVWQDRLMALDGVDASGLSRLHGELIATGWVDQNTGNTPILRVGAVPACYRATLAGIRAVQSVQATEAGGEIEDLSVRAGDEKPEMAMGRRKKGKNLKPDEVGAAT